MAQPKDFLYSLVDSDGKFFRVNNGVVEAVNTPAPLPTTPDGWQEKSIKYARNIKSSGLWRTYTLPLKYVKQGAHILRDRLYRFGTEYKIFQLIHRLAKGFNGGWVHKLFYLGQLDLTMADDDQETSVTCNIMEGGLIKLFKANESTQYDIDVNIPEAIDVKMDGLRLKQKASFLLTNGISPNDLKPNIPELVLLNAETVQSLGARSTTRTVATNSLTGGDVFPTKEFFLNPSGATEVKIIYNFAITLALVSVGSIPGTHYFFQLHGYDKEGIRIVNEILIDYTVDPIALYNHLLTFSGNSTVSIPAGVTELYLRSTTSLNGDNTLFTYENDGTIDVEYFYRHRTTFVKWLNPMTLGQKILDKMTSNGGYGFGSTHLSDKWANLLLTSGDAIRGFTNPKIRISWRDFCDSYNVPANVCELIRNNTLRIEKKSDAFQPTIQQDLGEVKVRIKTAKEYLVSKVSIGYPNTDTEDVNGRDEFNTTHLYTSSVTSNSNTLDLVSKVSASMYEQEILRINLDGKTTTDDSSDKKNFFALVEVTPTGGTGDEPAVYHKLLRETYTSITGLISPDTAYNIPLSPKRCLLAHGNYLRSVFFQMEGTDLVFQHNDKNEELKTVKDGITIEEKANVTIGNLDAPLFIPKYLDFECPMAENIIATMDQGPDGTFKATSDGEPIYGFPFEVSIQPSNRPAQQTILLCSPQTDITKFIHG
ncbi:MAG TPA: hypothetical protein VMZ03_03890 [Chitinophagaceae bacterium]|nr:hypothetical protein [Chitinophagaceae bacterium]